MNSLSNQRVPNAITIPPFDEAREIVKGRFIISRDFRGGIATIFANTATVESDFLILGCQKDEDRMSLTGISLEGIM